VANTQAMCSSFKKEILCGSHALGTQAANSVRTVTTADTFKGALFLTTASLGAATTAYSSTGELAATGNYSAGGNAITNATAPSVSGTVAIWTPSASVVWTALTSSGSFDTMLLYNTASTGSLAVGVFTFSAQSITAGTFTLTMPVNASGTALIQIS
jgi:hypothetical protein